MTGSVWSRLGAVFISLFIWHDDLHGNSMYTCFAYHPYMPTPTLSTIVIKFNVNISLSLHLLGRSHVPVGMQPGCWKLKTLLCILYHNHSASCSKIVMVHVVWRLERESMDHMHGPRAVKLPYNYNYSWWMYMHTYKPGHGHAWSTIRTCIAECVDCTCTVQYTCAVAVLPKPYIVCSAVVLGLHSMHMHPLTSINCLDLSNVHVVVISSCEFWLTLILEQWAIAVQVLLMVWCKHRKVYF